MPVSEMHGATNRPLVDASVAYDRLDREELRIRSLIERLERGGVLIHDGLDDRLNAPEDRTFDNGTDVAERSLQLGLLEDLEDELLDLDRARARVANGTYGRCGVCDDTISSERMEAVPTAAYCVQHGDHRT
jgi:RNA polymerase-binding transcription factor DksA